MRFLRHSIIPLAIVLAGFTSTFAQDPLSSWNDTAPKKAIISFVEKVTREGSPDFVPVSERIATFDNDGTLWAEQPMYFQFFFALDRVKAMAPKHPEWKDKEPFASLLKGDMKSALAGGEKAIGEIVMTTHSGMTTEEFDQIVRDWIATAKNPKTGRLLTEMVYQPMLELLAYLRANGFKTFIISGGGIEFMRPWTEKVYGIPPEQVVGSSGKTKFEMVDGRPVLMKLPEINFIDDKAGKPVGIQSHIGRRPIAAFGNSDGDLQMLQWTAAGKGPRLCLLVHHTDGEREFAYDRKSHIGQLDKGLDEAAAKGWTVVSMKDDWKTIFPEPLGRLTIKASNCHYSMSQYRIDRTLHLAAMLGAVILLAGCAQVATVSEMKPPRRAGFAPPKSDPLARLGDAIAKAEDAWRTLDTNPADTEARDDYNYAVARICSTLSEAKLAPWRAPIRIGARTLTWKRDPRPEWNPALYEIVPADQLKIGGTFVNGRETKDGLGAPLVAKRVADQAHEFAPTPHFFYGVTAVARFEGSRCVLAFEDPLARETVRVGRHSFPLAADYTAPLAMMLVEMKPKELGLPRLLHPAKFSATTRIARLEPFDPNKTIVLCVHGLMDSPATWCPLINHLRADEDVRRNYQFWFYSYPSGYPYPYSAAILRRELDHAEKRYPSRKKLVVLGHSMGGCISRLLITDTERRVWDRMFTASPESMDLTPEHKHILTESTIFSHRPEVGRVIFISAPLRGSDLASRWMGRIGAALVQAPKTLVSLGRAEARYDRHVAGDLHLKRYPDSVDTLAPNNHFVVAINKVPMKSGIPYHTIAGDRGRGDAPNSSDGVVPYWSSHLPDAHSEKIVPSHHSAHRHPEAFEEVHRILRLHAASQR